MYKIEKADYGYKLTFGDYIKVDEMKQWFEESKTVLANAMKNFYVFVDMRTLQPLPPESQPFMEEGQKLYKEKGMERSVVILNDEVTTMQFMRLAQKTGIYEWERYINAKEKSDWETIGMAWLTEGKDPDIK